jgi:ubiquinone/menaquinone biosynthesis C-methylase UbiE
MKQKTINEAYNAAAKVYAKKLFTELDYKPLDRQLLDRFAGMTKNMGPVCDMGCGPGEIANYLFKKKLAVVGIDIAANMIREAKRLNPEINFQVGDMFALHVKDGYFAGICSFYAIVNFQYVEIELIVKEYHRVLQNKGLLLIAFHVEEKEMHIADFFESGKALDFYFFNEIRIMDILKKNGFKIVEALVRFPYEQEYPSKRAYVLAEKL